MKRSHSLGALVAIALALISTIAGTNLFTLSNLRESSLRVLVVDDNPTNRLVAAKMLKDFDVQTDTACDGAEAITAANRFNYDLILMDVRMPEMDGLQATRAIRARRERSSTVPIIAFTANAFPEDIKSCKEAGMDDFVVKPARKKALVEAVLRVLPAQAPAIGRLPEGGAPPLAGATDASASDQPVFASEAFEELAKEIGEDAAAEIRSVFIGETDARLTTFRRLAIDSDRRKIGREAHSLKSAAATFGYHRLSVLAMRLEKSAVRMTESEYRELLDEVDAAYAQARAGCARGAPLSCDGIRINRPGSIFVLLWLIA